MPIIRIAELDDASGILEIYAPIVETSHWSFELEVPSIEDIQDRIEKILAFYPYLVLEDKGRILGYAYGSRFRERAAYLPSVETSIYMHPDVQGRGSGRRLYTALFDILKLAGFKQLFAGATIPNEVSGAFHEKLGFRHVGQWPDVGYKFGKYWDVGWWHRSIDDGSREAMDIVPFPELKEQKEFKELLLKA